MSHFDDGTILVTGATGLMCSALVDWLLKNSSAKIYVLGRSEKKLRNRFGAVNSPRIEYLVQDVVRELTLDVDFDFIFHGAGPMDRETIANRPLDVIFPNTIGLMNCADYCVKQQKRSGTPCRLVVFSSVTVYGSAAEDRAFNETDVAESLDLGALTACYSESKRMTEVLAYAYRIQYGIDVVIARISTVYGETKYIPETAFYQFIDDATNGRNIHLHNSNLGRRDNIYIDDAVRGLLVIAEKGISGEVYNLSSNGDKGNLLAIDEIAQVIAAQENELSGAEIDVTFDIQKSEERLPSVSLDNSKLKKLGWDITTSFADGVNAILLSRKSL